MDTGILTFGTCNALLGCMNNAFKTAGQNILLKRFGYIREELAAQEAAKEEDFFAIPMVGEDVEYGDLKETKEAKSERK